MIAVVAVLVVDVQVVLMLFVQVVDMLVMVKLRYELRLKKPLK